MPSAGDLDCKIYLDTGSSGQEVATDIAHLMDGTVERRTITAREGEFDVLENDDFDEIARKKFPDGFLHFSHVVEFYAAPHLQLEERVSTVAALLAHLWSERIPAVAACDYEDRLPHHGGYRSQSVPWVRELTSSLR